MEMREVQSSTLAKIGYDANLKLLAVEFTNGSRYVYNNVPAEVYAELMSSHSLGKYFGANIREAYKYTRVSE